MQTTKIMLVRVGVFAARALIYILIFSAHLFPRPAISGEETEVSQPEFVPVCKTEILDKKLLPGSTLAPPGAVAESNPYLGPGNPSEKVRALFKNSPVCADCLAWDKESGQKLEFDQNAIPSLVLSGKILTDISVFIGDPTTPIKKGPFQISVPLRREGGGIVVRVKYTDWSSQYYRLRYDWLKAAPTECEALVKAGEVITKKRVPFSGEEDTAEWLLLSWAELTDEEQRRGPVTSLFVSPLYQFYQLSATNLSNTTQAKLFSGSNFGVDLGGETRFLPGFFAYLNGEIRSYSFAQPKSGISLSDSTPTTWGFEGGVSHPFSRDMAGSLGLGFKEWLSMTGVSAAALSIDGMRIPELRAGASAVFYRSGNLSTGVAGSLAVLFPGASDAEASGWGHSESVLLYAETATKALVWRCGLGAANTSFSTKELSVRQQGFSLQLGVRYYFPIPEDAESTAKPVH